MFIAMPQGLIHEFSCPQKGITAHSFFYHALLDSNSLPVNMKSIQNKSAFKTAMKSHLFRSAMTHELAEFVLSIFFGILFLYLIPKFFALSFFLLCLGTSKFFFFAFKFSLFGMLIVNIILQNLFVHYAYRKHHFTETALVRISSDILQAIDMHGEVILVLLDLTAAFDTMWA